MNFCYSDFKRNTALLYSDFWYFGAFEILCDAVYGLNQFIINLISMEVVPILCALFNLSCQTSQGTNIAEKLFKYHVPIFRTNIIPNQQLQRNGLSQFLTIE